MRSSRSSAASSSTTGSDKYSEYPLEEMPSIRSTNTRRSICIIGSGAAGLITAHTLIQDGFTNVHIFSKDGSPGGVWEHKKVYPGVFINNLYGDYRFSSLEMPRYPSRGQRNTRLSAEDMQFYMEKFAETYLRDRIEYETEVLNIKRPSPPYSSDPPNWVVTFMNTNGEIRERGFHRIVLCTGGCHEPRIPREFSPSAVQASNFCGPVVHSSEFRRKLDDILRTQEETESVAEEQRGAIVVIGGGKSAQDIAAYLANEGRHRNVCMIYEKTDAFIASTTQLPDRIRKSRLMGVLSPSIELRTPLERFLHKTWLGGKIVRGIFDRVSRHSFKAFDIPKDSPLRLSQEPFWSLRVNDEVCRRGNSFHELAKQGKIKIIAPARAVGFGPDGQSIMLDGGRLVKADAVVLATGYTSSWKNLFDSQTLNHVGLGRYPPQYVSLDEYDQEWDYTSLKNPPPSHPANKQWMSCNYKGIVPARNILKRDLAINGAVFSTNNGYVFETTAHWISSYFLEDPFLEIPRSPKEAIEKTERASAWLRKRYPNMLHWTNESHSSGIEFWSWPQYSDDLLRDMGLAHGRQRTGGNCLTWLLKPIDIMAIATLGRERQLLRMQTV